MILVDTSVWIDHLRQGDAALHSLLQAGRVLVHPLVIGEIAMGNLRQRDTILTSLANLPQARVATDYETLRFVDANLLFGLGISYIDARLLASVRLTQGARLLTRDKRLAASAEALALDHR